jgi:hypothetical protein
MPRTSCAARPRICIGAPAGAMDAAVVRSAHALADGRNGPGDDGRVGQDVAG